MDETIPIPAAPACNLRMMFSKPVPPVDQQEHPAQGRAAGEIAPQRRLPLLDQLHRRLGVAVARQVHQPAPDRRFPQIAGNGLILGSQRAVPNSPTQWLGWLSVKPWWWDISDTAPRSD